MSHLHGSRKSLFDTMARFFKEDEWVFHEVERNALLMMSFRGEAGIWDCFAQVTEDDQRLVFYSILKTNVPTEKRQAIAEYLTRASDGLIMGNFEMNFSDGVIRSSGNCQSRRLVASLIDQSGVP